MSDIELPASFRDRPYDALHFQHIAQWARAHSPFYRQFLADGGVPRLLTRETVQHHNDDLLDGREATGRTSGATSIPVRVYWDAQRARQDRLDNRAFAEWHGGRLPNARIVALSAHQQSDSSFEVNSAVEKQFAFLQNQVHQRGIQCLVSYPTNLVRLADYIVASGQTVPALRRIVCMSELFEKAQERRIAKAFPMACITATYSSTETGLIAGRCPHNSDNYHIMAHKLGVEFLNADGRPCAHGELGQLVITDYFNRAMPFIRYAIGDLAAPVRCDCGKIDLPALTRLLGKQRGLLYRADGSMVFSTELSVHFQDAPEVRQYQVIQQSVHAFKLRIVARDGADRQAFESRMQTLFQAQFGGQTGIEFDWCAEIPRLPGGKYMEFIGLQCYSGG